MSDYDYTVAAWWDTEGRHHEGAPSEHEMLDDARMMTVHVTDSEGNELYFTTHAVDGWEPDELAADVEDAYDHYVGGK